MASSSDDGPTSLPFEAQLQALPPLRHATPPQADEEPAAWSSGFHTRSHSTTPRSRPASPVAFAAASSSPFRASRLSSSSGGFYGPRWWMRVAAGLGFSLGDEEAAERQMRQKQWSSRKKKVGSGGGGGGRGWRWRRKREIAAWIGMVAFFFLMNWWFFSRLPLEHSILRRNSGISNSTSSSSSMPATLVLFRICLVEVSKEY